MAQCFVGDVTFFINAKDFPAVVAALRAAAPTADQRFGSNYWGETILKESEGREPREALAHIFAYCGWIPYFAANGDITDLRATGWDAGAAETESLFYTIAPFVRDESSVQLMSDEGMDLVYHFREGQCMYSAKVDPLDIRPHARVLVSRILLERISAYLVASNGDTGLGAALAAELAQDINRD
jgi:hypothetical protein